MTREEAKRFLLAYRPDSRDRDDPEMKAALELTRDDSELAGWLREQEAFQRAVRGRLRELPLPAGLRERLLVPPPVIVPMWQQPAFRLLAACIGLGLIVAMLWARPRSSHDQADFPGFRSRMVGFALRLYRMDIVTNDFTEVVKYLQSRGVPSEYRLSPGLLATPVKGGASLSWQGHPVGMVCFSLTNKTLYMFVVDQSAIQQGNPPGPVPVLAQVAGISTASWTERGKVYVVAAATRSDFLRALVHPPGSAEIRGLVPTNPDQSLALVSVLVDACAPHQPRPVASLLWNRRKRQASRVGLGRGEGARGRPPVRFYMAIREREICRRVMIRSGKIRPGTLNGAV